MKNTLQIKEDENIETIDILDNESLIGIYGRVDPKENRLTSLGFIVYKENNISVNNDNNFNGTGKRNNQSLLINREVIPNKREANSTCDTVL